MKHYYIMGPYISQEVNGIRQEIKLAIVSEKDISTNITGEFIKVFPGGSEPEALRKENAELRAFKKEALEVIGFYGNEDNWFKHRKRTYYEIFKVTDIEPPAMVGGKRAREFLSKHNKGE